MYQITFECPRAQAEILNAFLSDTTALSVSLLDAGDEPLYEPGPDEMPLWSHVKVLALFEIREEAQAILLLLAQVLAHHLSYVLEKVEERDWVHETQAQFQPQCFNQKLWVYPEWHEVKEGYQTVLKLAPGLAFGTGTHPTTQMCLEGLVDFVLPHKTVLDFGCGSGILGLASVVLGAQKVYCVDIDPQALESTKNNALLNQIGNQKLFIGLVDALPTIQVDILVANILAKPLLELKPLFQTVLKPGGVLLLSGVLAEQADELIEAYKPWVTMQVGKQIDEWVLLSCLI